MAISFPTSLDNFSNPASTDSLNTPSHSLQHTDLNDAVEAMQRKVGIGTAVATSASAGQVLTISAAGTSTWSTPTVPALVQIVPTSVTVAGVGSSGSVSATGAVTFGTATSISIANTFSSDYENYRIVINITGVSTQMDVLMRLSNNGTDNSGAVYSRGGVFNYINSTPTALASVGDTKWQLGFVNSGTGSKNAFSIDMYRPNVVAETTASSLGVWNNNVTFAGFFVGYLHDSTASFNGFTVYPNTGTINSGTIRIYGYRS